MIHWSNELPQPPISCRDAIKWARTQPDADTAWRECRRGDWMAWWVGYNSGEPGSDARKRLALCLSDCVEISAHLADGDVQTAIASCLTTLRDWAEGGISDLDDVRAAVAAVAARAAYAADAAYASDYAARAAAVAARAAYAAVAAYASAYAAVAVANAAYAANPADASDYAARAAAVAATADIIREHYPKPPVLKGL